MTTDILHGTLALIFAGIYLFSAIVAVMTIYNARRFGVRKRRGLENCRSRFSCRQRSAFSGQRRSFGGDNF